MRNIKATAGVIAFLAILILALTRERDIPRSLFVPHFLTQKLFEMMATPFKSMTHIWTALPAGVSGPVEKGLEAIQVPEVPKYPRDPEDKIGYFLGLPFNTRVWMVFLALFSLANIGGGVSYVFTKGTVEVIQRTVLFAIFNTWMPVFFDWFICNKKDSGNLNWILDKLPRPIEKFFTFFVTVFCALTWFFKNLTFSIINNANATKFKCKLARKILKFIKNTSGKLFPVLIPILVTALSSLDCGEIESPEMPVAIIVIAYQILFIAVWRITGFHVPTKILQLL